jgi:cytochrome c556
MRLKTLTSLSLVAAMLAGVAAVQAATPEELAAAVEARQTHMKGYGAALRVLGGMAQGAVAYDAAAATEAANSLLALATTDQSAFWPEGSEAGAVAGSEALPALWQNIPDVIAKSEALAAAAAVMQTAAGTDLAALQAAMPAVGATCGACHELYRVPN